MQVLDEGLDNLGFVGQVGDEVARDESGLNDEGVAITGGNCGVVSAGAHFRFLI